MNSKIIKNFIPQYFTRILSGFIFLIALSGLVFFLNQGIYSKILSYSFFSAAIIADNIAFMERVYNGEPKEIQSRLFAISQILSKFSIPVTSLFLAFFSKSGIDGVLIASFGLMTLFCLALTIRFDLLKR